MRTLAVLSPLLVTAALGGCADDPPPADVAGNYTITVTNRDNECMLERWTVGETATGIPFIVTQSGHDATGSVEGPVGTYLDFVLGGHAFTGGVDGDHLSMVLFGTRSTSSGSCAWTVNVALDAVSAGNYLEGELVYEPQTNGSPDCAYLETCVNRQGFNGNRPVR